MKKYFKLYLNAIIFKFKFYIKKIKYKNYILFINNLRFHSFLYH